MAHLLTGTTFRGFTDDGAPLVGGKLWTYASGTTTLQPTYTDSALTTPNTNPITLNARGEAEIWLDQTKVYTFHLTTLTGSTVGDDVDDIRAPDGLPDVAAYWASTNVEDLSAEIGGILATMGARPERYADPGSGGDYTAALQSALNEGKGLYLQRGKIYGITAELTNTASNVAITGGGTIKFLAAYNKSGGTLSAISNTGSYFVVDDVVFDGSAVTSASTNSRFVFGNGFRLIVTSKARFLNLPSTNLGITFQGALQCSGNAAYSVVNGAFFYNCPGAVFFQGRKCVASNNVIINPHDASIALNGVSCVGCVVSNNIISNEDSAASIASMIAAEEGASEWVISGNHISGIKDGRGIAAISIGYLTAVRGGKIIGNVVNGLSYTTTNPCSLIEYNNLYLGTEVICNTMLNLPTGNSNSRALIVAATGGRIAENVIDGANVVGQVLCEIRQGALGLTIENNTTRSGASGQHFWFQVGDYTGNPVHFKGGKFYGGTNGINAETNIGSITGLKLYIDDPEDQSATNFVSATTQLGDRAAFLNAGAWARRPCHIGIFTNMYANAVLTAAGNQAIQNGDQFQYLAPTGTGGYIGYVRAAGAFKNYGVLA